MKITRSSPYAEAILQGFFAALILKTIIYVSGGLFDIWSNSHHDSELVRIAPFAWLILSVLPHLFGAMVAVAAYKDGEERAKE